MSLFVELQLIKYIRNNSKHTFLLISVISYTFSSNSHCSHLLRSGFANGGTRVPNVNYLSSSKSTLPSSHNNKQIAQISVNWMGCSNKNLCTIWQKQTKYSLQEPAGRIKSFKLTNLQTCLLVSCVPHYRVICYWYLEMFGSMMLRWWRRQWFQQAHTYVTPGSRQKHTRSNGMARPKWFTDVATLHSLNKFLGTFHNWYIDLVIGNSVLLCVWHLL